ncbi:MAG TPA: acyltransferase [Caulobacteraceae bacterium]
MSRGQPIKDRILSLQILRFVAAAMVIVFHAPWRATAPPPSGWLPTYPTAIGAAGVDIFFVLSGFVIAMTGPLARERPTGAAFFWKRWSRVAPLYFLLSIPWIIRAVARGKFNLPQTSATFLFWPAVGRGMALPYLEAGWTLCFEMVFYSTMAALLIGGRLRRNSAILAAVAVLLVAARLFSDWTPLRFVVNPVFLEFGAGVVLAGAWPRLRRAHLALGVALVLAAIAVFAIDGVVGVGDAIYVEPTMRGVSAPLRALAFGVPAALLVAGAAVCDRWVSGPVARAGAWLGDASYSIYLSQALSIPILTGLWFGWFSPEIPLASGACILLTAVAIGALTYVAIERPIMRDIRRLRIVRPGRSLAPASQGESTV